MNSFAYLFERFPSFVQTFVYREAAEMVRQGMEPWLVSLRRPDDPCDLAAQSDLEVFYAPEEKELRAAVDAERTARRLPWRPHRAIPRHRSESDSQRMFEAVWLTPRLRERGIHHVHAHFGGVAARTAWWLRKLSGFSYSFTGHANDIFCDTDFPVSNATLVQDARFVVTETDYAREWMEARYPRSRGKVFRVFNGLPLDAFSVRRPGGIIPRILSVGRFVEKKGFAVLIEACRLARARGAVFECEIIGDGPLEAALREQIKMGGLKDTVRLPGSRSQEEVRRLLSEAQIFVLACVPDSDGGSDNLPTVVMEAMASGLPVVSTRLAGVPEMITDGQDGLLTKPGDAEELARALEYLLSNSDSASRLGAKAQVAAEAKFAIARTTSALKHLLIERARIPAPPRARGLDPELPSPRRWLGLFAGAPDVPGQ